MRTIKFTYWQDGNFFIGFLNEYPDYQTQGETKEELAENLKDLLVDFESGQVLCHEEQEIESPLWHENILGERKRKMDSGAAEFIPLEDIKAGMHKWEYRRVQ